MVKRVEPEVLEVLKNADYEGLEVRILQQLDRKMYLKVKQVLTDLGGPWVRGRKAHVFESDTPDTTAAEILADVISTGEYIDRKSAYQQFMSTPEVAQMVVDRLGPFEPLEEALEPSAGTGVIARAMRDAGALVTCVEIDEKLADALMDDDFAIHNDDFLSREAPAPGLLKDQNGENWHDERYTKIGMNPPFTRSQDIKHVLHAYEWLAQTGRLVAIMSSGVTFREDKLATAFRDFVDEIDGEIEDMPEGSFKESGTMVNTVIVTLNKPEYE